MGIEIGAQLDALWRSLFLGAAFALLYDGLRALRLRRRTRRALTDLLDALYCLLVGNVRYEIRWRHPFLFRDGGSR